MNGGGERGGGKTVTTMVSSRRCPAPVASLVHVVEGRREWGRDVCGAAAAAAVVGRAKEVLPEEGEEAEEEEEEEEDEDEDLLVAEEGGGNNSRFHQRLPSPSPKTWP